MSGGVRGLAPALLVVALAAGAAGAFAAERATLTFVVGVPASTPADAPLYLAGNAGELGAWRPAGVALARTDGPASVRLVFEVGTLLEFKVTRGSWETVEKGAAGEEIANRTLRVERDDTVRVTVAAWRDQVGEAPRRSTRTGDVRIHAAFSSRVVPPRDVLVWLPPGYDAERSRRYPVLYFMDGNNAFDDSTSFAGEWRLDETAGRLIRSGTLAPFIAVAVYNTSDRIGEYTPVANAEGAGGRGEAFGRFLIEELKPFVDRTYRTRSDAEHTAIAGSSLGAVIALALAIDHPRVFGRVGCVSPAAWWADRDLVRRAERAPPGLRVWVDIGTDEGTPREGRRPWLDDTRALRAALERAGVPADRLHYEEIEGGRHNEAAWSARLDRVLFYLFGGRAR